MSQPSLLNQPHLQARGRTRGSVRPPLGPPGTSLLTKAWTVHRSLAWGLWGRRLLLGRVGVGVVLLRAVASVLQGGWVHGHHGGGPVAFSPSLLPPRGGTTLRAWSMQRRRSPNSWGALGRSLLLRLRLGLLGRRLLVHVVVVRGRHVPQERRKACGPGGSRRVNWATQAKMGSLRQKPQTSNGKGVLG